MLRSLLRGALFDLLNKTYSIKVEISGIGRSIDNITIKEKIDKNLKVQITPPFPNVLDPFDESDSSIEYLQDLDLNDTNMSANKNYSIDYNNNTITIKVNKLEPKHCIRYNFNITSDKTGVFPATTLVRIVGDASKPSDINIPFDIEVRPPAFEAHLEKSSSQVVAGDPLDITYNIIHKSGWCTDPFELSVILKNSTKDEYVLYRDDKIYNEGERINTSFNTLKYSPINATIIYNRDGKQLLPEIFVEDQVLSLPYEEREIYVYQNKLNRDMDEWEPTISSYGLFLGLLLSLIAIIYEINLGRKEVEILEAQLKNMDENLNITKIDFSIRLNKHLSFSQEEEGVGGEYIPYKDEEGVPRFSYDFNSRSKH